MGRIDRDQSFEERNEALPRRLPAGRHEKDRSFSIEPTAGDETDHGGAHSRNESHHRERVAGFGLDDIEVKALVHVGTFRALTLSDLARYHYAGNPDQALQATNHMVRHGLIEYRTTYPGPCTYVTLTPKGLRSIQALGRRAHPEQQLYTGFVRPREARHDATLYRLYHQEASQIKARGGRVTRVVLDFELKRSINRRLAKIGHLSRPEQLEHKEEIAQAHGLKVVNGKIRVPDLRLEYENPNHELGKVDLEFVTGNYRQNGLAVKAQAGFAMYALPEDAPRLRPAMPDPEIMPDLLSL